MRLKQAKIISNAYLKHIKRERRRSRNTKFDYPAPSWWDEWEGKSYTPFRGFIFGIGMVEVNWYTSILDKLMYIVTWENG